jgi:glycosyltransferase involved in cell wall biosynthesis
LDTILTLAPVYSPNVGGSESFFDQLEQYLRSKKVRRIIITYKPLTNRKKAAFVEHKPWVTIVRIPWPGRGLFYVLEPYPVLLFLYLFPGIFFGALFTLLHNRRKISVIHAHGLACGAVAAFLGPLFGIRRVLSLHTIYKFRKRTWLARIAKKIFNRMDALPLLAAGCRDDLVAIGVPDRKVQVYNDWVDLDRFRIMNKFDCRRRLQLKEDAFILLFLGRMAPEKGVELVASVAQDERCRDIIFIFVGAGPLLKDMKELNIRENIHVVGEIENQDAIYYFNAADALIWGSVDADYIGRVTIEALACGLPVILPNETEYFGTSQPVRFELPEAIGRITANSETRVIELLQKIKNGDIVFDRNACRRYAFEKYGPANGGIIFATYS